MEREKERGRTQEGSNVAQTSSQVLPFDHCPGAELTLRPIWKEPQSKPHGRSPSESLSFPCGGGRQRLLGDLQAFTVYIRKDISQRVFVTQCVLR